MQTGKSVDLFDNGPLLVPLTKPGLASSLSSGYVACNWPEDLEASEHEGKEAVVGFRRALPSWALSQNDGDPCVVLEIDPPPDIVERGDVVFFRSPPRVTKVTAAHFASDDQLRDFEATYLAFPDIPVDLLPLSVSAVPTEEVEKRPEDLEVPLTKVDRTKLDALAGWNLVLVEELLTGGLAREVSSIGPRSEEDGWKSIAASVLESVHPEASKQEKLIWNEMTSLALAHRASRGFDRRALLDEFSRRVTASGEVHDDVRRWIEVVEEVLSAQRDLPPFSDEKSIGGRAALAILLAQDEQAIESLAAGPKVAFLARLFVGAFQGLSRAAGRTKNDRKKLDAILNASELVARGHAAEFSIGKRNYDRDLRSTDEILLNGEAVLERVSDAPAYLMMLNARARETGQVIVPEEGTGRLCIAVPDDDQSKVYMEEEPGSDEVNTLVRVWKPLIKVTSRVPSATKLKDILEESWASGCAVGIRDINGQKTLCCNAVFLMNTLDRDEFEYHVLRIREFAAGMA